MTRFTTYSLTALFSAALLALAPSALAVDGTILINQNTSVNGLPGCPNAGFPIIICQPGSYKLSGNLTMSTSATGNYAGLDIAIGISSSGVVFDLNGFSIIVNNGDSQIGHNFYAIAELGTFSNTSIKNGTITVNSPRIDIGIRCYVIYLFSSSKNSMEDVSFLGPFAAGIRSFSLGSYSLVRHVRIPTSTEVITCPTLIVENIGIGSYPSPCVYVSNLF